MSGGLRPRVVEQKIVPCAAAPSTPRWQASVEALADLARDWGKRKADASIVLSNHFVRYALVPWSDQLSDEDEEAAFARHCFSKTYGDALDGWEMRLSAEKTGAPRLASAVDRALIEALRTALAATRLNLVSIQPLLMAAFNCWHRTLAGRDAWLLLAEPERYCCASWKGGTWQSVRAGKISRRLEEELPQLLARERHLGGSGNGRDEVFVFAPGAPRFELPAEAGWLLRRLELPRRGREGFTGDACFAMVLSGSV